MVRWNGRWLAGYWRKSICGNGRMEIVGRRKVWSYVGLNKTRTLKKIGLKIEIYARRLYGLAE